MQTTVEKIKELFPDIDHPDKAGIPPVFPCRSSKAPIIKGWQEKAASTMDGIEEIFHEYPYAWVGMKTGNGLYVIDIDPKNGGSLSNLLARWPSLSDYTDAEVATPEGLTYPVVKTPSGGIHIYFQYHGDEIIPNSAGRLAKGVDVRGDGGYVCVPPSPGYTSVNMNAWLIRMPDVGIPYLPHDVAEFLTTYKKRQSEETQQPFGHQGSRNNDMFKVAAYYRAIGLDEMDILTLLKEKNTRFEPPLDILELIEIAKSAMRYQPDEINEAVEMPDSLLNYTMTSSELALLDIEQPQAFLGNFLVKGSMTLIHAAPGTGKTPLALQMVQAAMTGKELFGWRKDCTATAKSCLYLDGEMPLWLTKRNVMANLPTGEDYDIRIFNQVEWLKEGHPHIDLLHPISKETMRRTVNEMKPDIIVLDNRSNFYSGEENNNDDAIKLNNYLMELRGSGACIIINHHQGKSGASRGASAIHDIMDTVIGLQRVDHETFIKFDTHFEKARFGYEPNYNIQVTLKVNPMGKVKLYSDDIPKKRIK